MIIFYDLPLWNNSEYDNSYCFTKNFTLFNTYSYIITTQTCFSAHAPSSEVYFSEMFFSRPVPPPPPPPLTPNVSQIWTIGEACVVTWAMLAVAYATSRASHVTQVTGEDPDKKVFQVGGWAWGQQPHTVKKALRNLKEIQLHGHLGHDMRQYTKVGNKVHGIRVNRVKDS